jgi:DNA (cytosine-5)-methyltransferase 1
MKHISTRIGSLCTGYGGLDMAVRTVFGGKLVWCADNDRHVATILDERYPGVLNLGDITTLDWPEVAPVDIIATGFPCQDISYSGKGLGIEKGAKSGIWKNITQGICILQPKLIIVENVAAIRRRGLDQVLGDLAERGYDTVWTSLRASDVGAAHQRERVPASYRPITLARWHRQLLWRRQRFVHHVADGGSARFAATSYLPNAGLPDSGQRPYTAQITTPCWREGNSAARPNICDHALRPARHHDSPWMKVVASGHRRAAEGSAGPDTTGYPSLPVDSRPLITTSAQTTVL